MCLVIEYYSNYTIIHLQHIVKCKATPQQTWDVEPMLAYCWSNVYDAGPVKNQHWCVLGLVYPTWMYYYRIDCVLRLKAIVKY